MSTATQGFGVAQVGVAGDPVEFQVERDRIKAYAAATNDPMAQHAAGDIAPPVFAIVPAFQAAAQAGVAVIPGELIGMVVHGEQDFRYHGPIRPDTTLVTTATATGVHQRSSGVVVCVKAETVDKTTDELLVEQYMTSFVRGAQTDSEAGEPGPGHAFPEELRSSTPAAEVEQTFDEDQTFRYAAASGDPMPIHTDDAFAKQMGLPGIIIHGLCTMAFTSVAAIQHASPDDPAELKRLAVRFAKIVQPRQTIRTKLYDAGGGAFHFETASEDGSLIIKDGLAQFA